MLEDIVNFCPTLSFLEVPYNLFFERTIVSRQDYFASLGNVKYAKNAHAEGSALSRALSVAFDHFRLFQNVYRRKNRRWRVTGTKEVVCAPLRVVYSLS